MSLQETLNKMKEEFEAGAPSEALEIMHKATDDLKNSDILKSALKVGDQAPDFTLSDQAGNDVSSKILLEKGPLVVSFYRGVW